MGPPGRNALQPHSFLLEVSLGQHIECYFTADLGHFNLQATDLQSLAASSQICFLLVLSKDKCVSIHYVTCHLFSCTEYIIRIILGRIIDELCHLKTSFGLSANFLKDLFSDFLFKLRNVVNKLMLTMMVFFLFLNMSREKQKGHMKKEREEKKKGRI